MERSSMNETHFNLKHTRDEKTKKLKYRRSKSKENLKKIQHLTDISDENFDQIDI